MYFERETFVHIGGNHQPMVLNGSANILYKGMFHEPDDVLSAMKITTGSEVRSFSSISATPGAHALDVARESIGKKVLSGAVRVSVFLRFRFP